MLASARVLIVFVLLLATAGPVQAQQRLPRLSALDWQASYWSNPTLSGAPAVQRSEVYLDHDWGFGSPDPHIPADRFSARWNRFIDVAPGLYRFSATSDDGIRVWVDGELIIDQWHDHAVQTFTADKYLERGQHWVLVEYYENGGLAVIHLSWVPAPAPARDWRGEYYYNLTLGGAPALVRADDKIDFNWEADSPAPSIIGPDLFSVRWSRTLDLPAGHYRFSMTVDDGGRLWVDHRLLIDAWWDQAARTYTGEVFVLGGAVPVTMEYYEKGGKAVAQLKWEQLSAPILHWRGEYYDNPSLAGDPALIRDDAEINFNWGHGSPDPAVIPAERFSARWSQTLDLPAGAYRFAMTVDDGGRLWVADRLLIASWQDQAAQTYTGDIYLPGGLTPVRMEYYEQAGLAVAQLAWQRLDAPPPQPAEVIVDDGDPGFVAGGSASGWHTAIGGYYRRLTWTRNNDWARPNYNWARWVPELPAGRYEVLVFIPGYYATTTNARYWVAHGGNYTLRRVDQSANENHWVSLGVYWFTGDGSEYLSLSDVTQESRLSRVIAFDAAKWVPR